MNTAIHVTVRQLQMSAELGLLIDRQAQRLSRLSEQLSTLSVVVEQPGHRHPSGGPYCARVELQLPGRRLVARRSHRVDPGHSAPSAVLAEAFHAVEHPLRRYSQRQVRRHHRAPLRRSAEVQS